MASIFNDLLSNASTFDSSPTRTGVSRSVVRELEGIRDLLDDPGYQNGFTGRDEVQQIADYDGTVSGGTFDLTINLAGGTSFTAEEIDYDATSSQIQDAIDVAADGTVTGWSNGDIAVTGGPLTTDPISLKFTGSVGNANHPLVSVDGGELEGEGEVGAITQVTSGQSGRSALAVLFACGIFAGTLPEQGGAPNNIVDAAGFTPGPNPHRISEDSIRALCLQAAIDEGRAELYKELLDIAAISI